VFAKRSAGFNVLSPERSYLCAEILIKILFGG